MKRYKVRKYHDWVYPFPFVLSDDILAEADKMKNIYGLDKYNDIEIIAIWKAFSEEYACGWLPHDKETIESAFGVELEEIS